ncbi:MAG TPA: glycosyltransferase family 2 protein [Candidatus Hydrogenedentes bacterium]|nr:glycosyltransferase family 2 protein [Candidatus Hydrogenedentota bacterium]
MTRPLTHVLVINWNGLAHLDDCFRSLTACPGDHLRFVLVDNASTDGSADFVRGRFGADPRVELLVLDRNLGWSGGNNAGIRRALEAGAAYVFLLNNDTRVCPDVFDRCLDLAGSDPKIGVVAPKMVLFDQPFVLNSVGVVCSRAGACWDVGAGRADGPRWNGTDPVLAACGGACLIRAETLRRTGLLPEEFEIYLDDVDLCVRAWDAGYTVAPCPEAVVEHKFSASMGAGERARRKYFLATRNRFYLLLRNLTPAQFLTPLPWVALGELRAVGRACLEGEGWRAWSHVRAWVSALAYIPAARRHRRERRAAGAPPVTLALRFHLERLFCAPVTLPENGWYPPRQVDGLEVRPLSARAWVDAPPGGLRVISVNCYPALGASRVRVSAGGRDPVLLEAAQRAETWLDFSGGRLEFAAERLFSAEETGEHTDHGGWIAIVPDGGAGTQAATREDTP